MVRDGPGSYGQMSATRTPYLHQARFPGKESQPHRDIQIDAMLRSGFFQENAIGDGPTSLGAKVSFLHY